MDACANRFHCAETLTRFAVEFVLATEPPEQIITILITNQKTQRTNAAKLGTGAD